MASTSGAVDARPSSSLATTVLPKKHDVFISFRGEDTRDNFTSHLHAALCRNNIETYIDNRLEKGDEVWPTLVQAIQDSSVFLIIFSKDYASSTWCLNELNEIMECKKNGQHVIPVFYKVNPSDVRKQTGSYHTAFAKHEKDSKHSEEKVQKWKAVLFEASNIVGFGFSSGHHRTESDLIEDIIKAVLRKLNHKYSKELRVQFILDQNYQQIASLLRVESREVEIIGIWGMGGIGKTTIATIVFHNFSSQYEGSCFLGNVSEQSERHGLNYICNRLLSKLLREDLHIDTPNVISSIVMNRLRHKRVLIVLDDVNTSELLENLVRVGCDGLGAGSKVIVTTKDKQVVKSGGVEKIHEVKEMNSQNSFRLFSFHAFNKTHPEKGYVELSKRVIGYAEGIPLALKVLGLFLRSKSENEWDSALAKLKKIPNAEILKVLRLSYDVLDDAEKDIFLDIACFFKGHERVHVTRILNACGFFAEIGIRNLLDKALITTNFDNCIEMRDLMQEMGREIVREKDIKNPGRRSRLWDSEEVCDILKNNKGTDAVESIYLDMTQITELHVSTHAFRKMPNLRLLAFDNGISCGWKRINNSMSLPMDLGLSNNLRYIRWDEYPLKSLSSTCWPEKLVELSMRFSNVKKLWNGVQNLPNLETIDLDCSKCLIECPNLSGAPNLKYVSFDCCTSLAHVHPSIFSLKKLEELCVTGCKALKSLCGNYCSPFLCRVAASDCINLQEFSISTPTDHLYLCLRNTSLNELPSSILRLRKLGRLWFSISESLMDLPENFTNHIVLCSSDCDDSITLRKLLPSSGFQYVRSLTLYGGQTLSELPDNIWLLSSLKYLSLIGSDIISLPESIKYLPQLKHLQVSYCKVLESVPALPQSVQCFEARNCGSLKTVLCSRSEPSRKQMCAFIFLNCIKLDQDTYDNILKDAIIRIELGIKPSSKVELESIENEDLNGYTYMVRSGKICYFLPARSEKVRDWLHCYSTQASVTVELPQNSKSFGFIFYFVLCQVQSCHIDCLVNFGCECYLETCCGERVDITSFFIYNGFFLSFSSLIRVMSDHMFLWYDAQCCEQIMEAIEESKAINDGSTTYNPKLTFKFFARTKDNEEAMIKECGIRWVYRFVKKGGGCKSKRSREILELEASAVQNEVEGSEFDEPEEPVPPTKKFKQCVVGTPSNLEVEEMEGLRLLLEECLHIDEDHK